MHTIMYEVWYEILIIVYYNFEKKVRYNMKTWYDIHIDKYTTICKASNVIIKWRRCYSTFKNKLHNIIPAEIP